MEKPVETRSRAWRMLREGGVESITYLPGRPETAELGPRWVWRMFGLVCMLMVSLGATTALVGVVVLIRLLAGWLRK